MFLLPKVPKGWFQNVSQLFPRGSSVSPIPSLVSLSLASLISLLHLLLCVSRNIFTQNLSLLKSLFQGLFEGNPNQVNALYPNLCRSLAPNHWCSLVSFRTTWEGAQSSNIHSVETKKSECSMCWQHWSIAFYSIHQGIFLTHCVIMCLMSVFPAVLWELSLSSSL